MKKINSKIKLQALAFVLILFIIFIGIGIFDEYRKQADIYKIDEGLRLKASEEDIIEYRKITLHSNEDTQLSGAENTVVLYTYITDEEVPQEQYKGFNEDISKRTSNSQSFEVSKNDDETKYIGKFYPGVRFVKRDNKWLKTKMATTTVEFFSYLARPTILTSIKNLFIQSAYATVATTTSASSDGYVYKYDDDDWTYAHEQAVGDSADYVATTMMATAYQNGIGGDEVEIRRMFLPIDTSSIPVSANISSASLYIYPTSISGGGTNEGYVAIVQTDQPSISSLTTADFNNCGATSSAQLGTATSTGDIDSITTSAYFEMSLNSTGVGWIKKSGESSNCGTVGTTGYTCLGLRLGNDIENIRPGNMLFPRQSVTIYSANNAVNKPYIEITYSTTPAPPANPSLFINGATMKINGTTMKIN